MVRLGMDTGRVGCAAPAYVSTLHSGKTLGGGQGRFTWPIGVTCVTPVAGSHCSVMAHQMNNPAQIDDDVEDGEIECIGDYDPAFECPGGNEVSQCPAPRRISSPSPPPPASATTTTAQTTVFRLIRLSSPVLPRSSRVAVLDGHAEVSVGRDVAPSARVRLKEMAVSKFHASIYWDGLRREWGIVDMGSVHGTFVRSAHEPSTSALHERALGTRLSDARKSSMPRVLRHLDQITIGRTTFLVHEHVAGRPCPECATDGSEEITLFAPHARAPKTPPGEDGQSLKRKRGGGAADERDPKKAMAKLKNSLMSRHAPSSAPNPNAGYKDRSALRRVLHPEPRVPSTPSSLPHLHADQNPPPDLRIASPPPPPPPPPAALPSSNIGHKLLLLQGWNPGTALGENPDEGLVEPINVSANAGRAGLGSSVHRPQAVSRPSGDWREDAKQRRWDGVR